MKSSYLQRLSHVSEITRVIHVVYDAGLRDGILEKYSDLGKPHVRILGVQPEFSRKGRGVETPCRMGCGNSSVNMNHY